LKLNQRRGKKIVKIESKKLKEKIYLDWIKEAWRKKWFKWKQRSWKINLEAKSNQRSSRKKLETKLNRIRRKYKKINKRRQLKKD